MTDVKSKNLYELLGNTSDQDSDREPDPPTKTVDKPTARAGKREAPKTGPTEADAGATRGRGRGGNRSGGFSGNEAAFRDRATGRRQNRDQPTTETQDGTRPGRDSGPGVRRGGRGDRGPRRGGDRHSRTGIGEHPKQQAHGWGENTGTGEWGDEKAGEAIAAQETRDEAASGAGDAKKNEAWNENAEPVTITEEGQAPAEQEAEEQDNSKSYADYLAEQAQKKLEGLGLKEARAPNEGAKDNKKWKSAKELTKADSENYFKGEDKARRERERSSKKEFLDIDYTFKEPPRDTGRGGRGGRGRARGGERGDFRGEGRGDPRGDFRGGRGGRGGRGEGRGSFRGEGRGSFRGEGRGGRGRSEVSGSGIAVDDDSAFPSLGGK